LPVTDLTVPVPGGQPITVTRVYNSQQADVLGDFGYGWSLQATTSALSLVTEPAEEGAGVTAFRPGDLVYVTIPGGGQHAFQFWPTPDSYEPGAGEGTGADPYGSFYQEGSGAYSPQFLCVDGSGCTLTVLGIGPSSLTYNPDNRELYLTDPDDPGSAGSLFDPSQYVMTTPDGTAYTISGSSGAITSVKDANANITNYGTDSISSGGVTVQINRTNGLISSIDLLDAGGDPILDAEGNPIGVTYHYDDSPDELSSVTARDGTTTSYAYSTDPALPHYLTTVTDARNVAVLNANYNTLGELSSLTDAQGNAASVTTGGDDGSGDSQAVTDPAAQSNTQDIQDSEGNVIREIQSIVDSAGVTTGYQVTVHQYTYFSGDLTDEISNIFPAEGDAAPGVSNQNTIQSQIDYQPFTVSDLPDALSQQPDPSTIAREVDFGGAGGGAQGLPVSETDYLAGGATRVTTYGDYKFGKPQVTTVSTYAAGVSPETGAPAQTSVTRSFIDNDGNVAFSFDALGQGTEYDYDSQGDLTETWQTNNWSTVASTWDPNDPSTWHVGKLTTQPQSQNLYYTATDISNGTPGAFIGQVKESIDAAGNQTWFAYDSLGDQALSYKLWINPTAGQPDRWVGTTTTFDADGRPTGTVNAVYLDDGSGVLPTAPILGGGPSAAYQYVQASTTAYNVAGQVSITTDQYGRQTQNFYDVNNNVVKTINANGTVVLSVYDLMNRVIWQTDPFDPNGPATSVLATHTIYNSLGQVSATERWTGVDIQISGTDPVYTSTLVPNDQSSLISSSSTIYNAQGQVAETTNAAGLRTGTVYYSDGEVQYTGPLNTVADAATGATVAPVGGPYNLSDFASYTQYLYNQVDSNGQLYNRVIDADGHHTDTYTDLLGRTTETVYDDGSFTQTLYGVSGNPVPGYEVTIPAGGSEKVEIAQRKTGDPMVVTIYVSDASGNLTDVYQPAVPDPNNGGALTRPHTHYGYDQEGDETSQTDANNDTTTFTFDQNGDELTRQLPPSAPGSAGPEEFFTYNVNNQVATHTDFDGNTAVYTYYGGSGANAGALQEVVYGGAIGSGKATETVTYTYTSLGQQATVTDASGTTTDSYDAEGDLVDQDTPEGDIQHTYSPVTGELTETKTANTDVTYAYNDLGELTTTTVKELNGQELATPLVTTDAYDAAGNKTSEILPDGELTTWNYDDLNRLTSMSEVQGTTTLFTQSFTLNDDGTRASSDQTQLQPDGSVVSTHTTWSNDALGRLTSETLTSTSNPGLDYTDIFKYDLVGNRLTSAHTGPGNGADENITNTYNGDDELTKEVSTLSGETDLEYDANGSLTSQTNGSNVTIYGYDVRNKMISADVNGVTATYVYDDAGNRIAETSGGVTTFYLTDDANPTGYAQPIEQKASAAAAPTVTYVIGDRVLGQANASGAVSYLLTDGHGSTRALTNSAGAVTQTFNYTAFGSAAGFTPSASTPIYLFGGDAVFDDASGLYMNGDGTRDRLPGAGSFIEADPQGHSSNADAISLHKYLYVGANPINAWDQDGHEETAAGEVGVTGIQSLLIRAAVVGVNVASKVTPVITLALAIATISNPQAAESFLASGGNPADLAESILADVSSLEIELTALGKPLAGSLAEESRLFQLLSPRTVASYLPASEADELASLAQFRSELGLLPAPGEDTLAKLCIGDREFYGINASGQTLGVSVNATSATHAEIDALNQAKLAGASADHATLYVDRAPCYACWDSGAIRSVAAQIGVRVLEVVYPGGRVTFVTGTRG